MKLFCCFLSIPDISLGGANINENTYMDFEKRLKKAKGEFVDREAKVQAVIESLETDMDFLAVTGVEDKL